MKNNIKEKLNSAKQYEKPLFQQIKFSVDTVNVFMERSHNAYVSDDGSVPRKSIGDDFFD